MGSPAYEIDDSQWPVVTMKLVGALSTDDYRALLDGSEKVMARRQKYVSIVDLRELRAVANAAQRRLIASRIREMELQYGDLSLGTIVIVNSVLVRGALTAVEWLRRRQKRDIWVASMAEAVSVANDLCTRHGLTHADMRKLA